MLPSKYPEHDLASLKKVMPLLFRLCLRCTYKNPYKEQGLSSENNLYTSLVQQQADGSEWVICSCL